MFKFILYHAAEAHKWGMELQLYPSFSLCTTFRWMVNATHSSCVLGKESQYPSQGRCMDQGWSEQFWKISSALRSKPRTILPVASRYTDCYLGRHLKDRSSKWKLFSLPLLYAVCYRFEHFQYWKIAQIRIGQHVLLFQIFESASFLGLQRASFICVLPLSSHILLFWELNFCRCWTEDSGVRQCDAGS